MPGLPKQVLDELIEIGRANREEIPPSLADREFAWTTRINGCPFWRELAANLRDDDLENLIRGWVLHSRASGDSGGSVSPVIWLFQVFQQRCPSREPELTQWIFANRVNDYEPYGSTCREPRVAVRKDGRGTPSSREDAQRSSLSDAELRENKPREAERQHHRSQRVSDD
jgi:hypothetical protein